MTSAVPPELAAGLMQSGIGKVFHDRTLAEIPKHGPALQKWAIESARSDTRAGRGWTVVGDNANAQNALKLLGRAAYVMGLSVQVLTLRRVVYLLEADNEETYRMAKCEALCIAGFYQHYPAVAVPAMTGREIQEVEEFLTDKLDNRRALFLHSSHPIGEISWWSEGFLKRVAEANRTLEVGG